MHDLLMDFIFDLSEGQQALIMFGSMVLMIVLAVPIPIAVAIGTAIGYFMMDLNLVQVVLSGLLDGAGRHGTSYCEYGAVNDWQLHR
jgi:hypothetical protein